MEFSSNESLRKVLKPSPALDAVIAIISSNWSIQVNAASLKKLESYDDANFYVEDDSRQAYLIKFYNGADSLASDIIFGYAHLLRHINQYFEAHYPTSSLCVPKVVPSSTGADIVYVGDCDVVGGTKSSVGVCIYQWIAGKTLNSLGYTARSLVGVGTAVGMLTESLGGYDNSVFHRFHIWDLPQFAHSTQFIQYVEEEDIRSIIEDVHRCFTDTVLPASKQFSKSIVMGDCNDANVIATDDGSSIAGIIDFGDAVLSWTVNDIAVALAYALLSPFGLDHPEQCVACLLGGYFSVRLLQSCELEHVRALAAIRLSMSIAIGSYSIFQNPANKEYLSLHSRPAKAALRKLWQWNDAEFLGLCQRVSDSIVAIRAAHAPSIDTVVDICTTL